MPPLERFRALVRPALVPPSAGSVRQRLAALLVAVGLFTVSWERLGNIGAGPYNVKLPALAFSLAALIAAPEVISAIRGLVRGGGARRIVALLLALTALWYVVRALTTVPIGPGLAQIAALCSGALLPAVALLATAGDRARVVWFLRWLVAGAVVAALYGLYQLLAFYTGLPQGIVYTGVGTSGEGGRISAFNYEPAYFAYFIVLAVGAHLAAGRLSGRRIGWPVLTLFAAVLVLANVRALMFVVPLVIVLLLVCWRRNGAFVLRALVAGTVVFALNAGLPIAVAAAVDAAAPQQQASSPRPTRGETAAEPSTTDAPTDSEEQDDEESASGPSRPVIVPPQPAEVLDPHEQSSNAPRLELYRAVLKVDLAHLAVGVGPGHLRDALADVDYVAPNQGGNVVANNVWLQAGADGGVPLVVLELASALAVVVLWWRRRRYAMQPLLSAWIGVLAVGGMLTSYFFDVKLWVVLALGLAMDGIAGQAEDRASA